LAAVSERCSRENQQLSKRTRVGLEDGVDCDDSGGGIAFLKSKRHNVELTIRGETSTQVEVVSGDERCSISRQEVVDGFNASFSRSRERTIKHSRYHRRSSLVRVW